jgi:hypothetical protein
VSASQPTPIWEELHESWVVGIGNACLLLCGSYALLNEQLRNFSVLFLSNRFRYSSAQVSGLR